MAIGYLAGYEYQGEYSIAIGDSAGQISQSANSIILNAQTNTALNTDSSGLYIAPIRNREGITHTLYYDTTTKEIAYGLSSSGGGGGSDASINELDSRLFILYSYVINETVPLRNSKIAIGISAGEVLHGDNTVAIGSSAGYSNQNQYSVAIGQNAGSQNQNQNSLAIGNSAGRTDQANNSIAIGRLAGYSNQNQYSLAIGNGAGYSNQNQYSVAIGSNAGYENQGEDCIAIGRKAGQNDQSANSIVLNAQTNTALNTDSSGLYIAPIRNVDGISNLLYYDTTTKEIVYSSQAGGGGGSSEFDSDYTSSRTNTGQYYITFGSNNLPNSSNYTIIVTTERSEGTSSGQVRDDYMYSYWDKTSTGFRVEISEQDNGGTAGTYRDCRFDFCCIKRGIIFCHGSVAGNGTASPS